MKVSDEQIVAAIKGYTAEHGYAPSTRDVMSACGLSSTGATRYRLIKLRDSGVIKFDDGVQRSIRVV